VLEGVTWTSASGVLLVPEPGLGMLFATSCVVLGGLRERSCATSGASAACVGR
jgi:hypothetical protein